MNVTERTQTVPVLIADDGSAGLTAAIALARRGAPSMIVERRPDLSGLPRATAISLRSMELLRGWGLEDEIRAGGIDVEWQGWACETLTTASAGSATGLGMPTREQSALISPTAPACVPQDHLEPVLLRHLRSFEAARPAMGAELLRVENDPNGV